MKLYKKYFILILIIAVGAVFRFYNLNWDNNHHLNPDERFLALVHSSIKIPKDKLSYFDQSKSTLNPRNRKHKFFVYGTFPITLNKILSKPLKMDNYNESTQLGRHITAFLDLSIILIVFLIVQIFEKKYKWDKSAKYWSSFLYACAVLPIQQAHFFTTDTFLNFFVTVSIYFSILFQKNNDTKYLISSAVFWGLGIASKLTAIFVLPLIIFFSISSLINKKSLKKPLISIENILITIIIFITTAYITTRIADPYLYQYKNIFNPTISEALIKNIKTLKSWEGSNAWFPPGVQWINTTPVFFPLKNIIYFGFGLPISIIVSVSFIKVFISQLNSKNKPFLFTITSIWILSYFLYQSTQFVKSIRYFLIIFPSLAIIGGWGISSFNKSVQKSQYKKLIPYPRIASLALKFTSSIFVIFIIIWPLMFISIYTKKQTRVTASEWIYENIPANSFVLIEHWDDPLPLLLPNKKVSFDTHQLEIYAPDTKIKMDEINYLLERADYYILSSNRGWGSITNTPAKFPLMSQFYKDLFAEKKGYRKIAEFNSHPSLKYLGLPITIDDEWADEAFTVYDHPVVMIYGKKNNVY